MLFLCALLQNALQLSPVPYAQTFGGTFLVSNDGQALFIQETGVSRIDRRTGRKVGAEVLRIADFGGLPSRVASRTTSQNLNATVGAPPFDLEPKVYAAARDFDHLLVANRTVITEFGFRDRGKNPNRNWPFDVYGHVVDLRYGPQNTIEAWTYSRGTGNRIDFIRYVGSLASPQEGMRRVDTIHGKAPDVYTLRPLPAVGGFDPATNTYILGMSWGGGKPILLVDLEGKLVRQIPHRNTAATSIPDAAIEWLLRGPSAKLPGGKAAWEPLAFSGNRKFWLLRRRRDGETFVLRR